MIEETVFVLVLLSKPSDFAHWAVFANVMLEETQKSYYVDSLGGDEMYFIMKKGLHK